MAELGLAIAPIAYKALIKTWNTLDDSLSFSEDSQDLLIRLETARAHLSIWASLSGLDYGELEPDLLAYDALIVKSLERITALLSDADEMKKQYGITIEDVTTTPTQSSKIDDMRRLLFAATFPKKSKRERLAGADLSRHAIQKRLSWGIYDKKKFENFISLVETHVNGLHKLLPDSRRKRAQHEETRFTLRVVEGLSDTESLLRFKSIPAVSPESTLVDVSSLAEWKSIALQRNAPSAASAVQAEDFSLSGSTVADRMKPRFLKRGRVDPDACYLFEKKEYDLNISDSDKDLLRERIRKLVTLLGSSRTNHQLHTLQAVGYIDDTQLGVWWIVFRFPIFLPPPSATLSQCEPVSLRNLFTSGLKPSLEQRFALARRLTGTFAKLYASDWMHKSINSQNIIFPVLLEKESLRTFRTLGSALVQGFGYSRQHTEDQTVDRGKAGGQLESAIYRHPYYQGEAASGYQVHYDIYSFGLLLFEIAVWAPLMDLLAATPRQRPPVELSPKMGRFHETEALELKRRTLIRVEHDLPFRVGSKYAAVVRWCMTLEGPISAVEFYNCVAIPLGELPVDG